MKKIFVVFILFLTLAFTGLFLSYDSEYNEVHGSSSGSPAGRTGSPGDGQTCKSCHSGPAAINLSGLITSNIPTSGYVPGTTYQVTASISAPGHTKFGFQVSPQNMIGTLLGTLVNTSTQTQLVGTGKYVTHTNGGNQGVGSKSWSFDWIAPSAGTGSVTFYGAFNVTNANSQSSGDTIYTSTLVVNESTVGINDVLKLTEKVKVFPTITSDFCNYSINLSKESKVKVELYDASGRLVRNLMEEEFLNDETNKQIDLSALPTGYYFIHTQVGTEKDVKKIIVTK